MENEKLSILRMTSSLERALQISKKYLSPTDQTSSCGILELERALQRRDPLGIGYHNKLGLDLLSRLLKWDPSERISVREALSHAYFAGKNSIYYHYLIIIIVIIQLNDEFNRNLC